MYVKIERHLNQAIIPSRDEHTRLEIPIYNCSCSLIGIMRFTTDTGTDDTETDVHVACQHWTEGDLFDNDINIWKWSITTISSSLSWLFPSSRSFSFIKIRYFHINMWLLLSLPDVSIILTREQHIFNLLIPWMMRLRVEETGRVQVCAISWGKIRYKRKDDSSESLLCRWMGGCVFFFFLASWEEKRWWMPLNRKWITANRFRSVTYFSLSFQADRIGTNWTTGGSRTRTPFVFVIQLEQHRMIVCLTRYCAPYDNKL